MASRGNSRIQEDAFKHIGVTDLLLKNNFQERVFNEVLKHLDTFDECRDFGGMIAYVYSGPIDFYSIALEKGLDHTDDYKDCMYVYKLYEGQSEEDGFYKDLVEKAICRASDIIRSQKTH
jgi:hypothetical protein